MNCPRNCGAAMVTTEKQGIMIDYCPKCHGIWLDNGELEKFIELSDIGGKEAVYSPPPVGGVLNPGTPQAPQVPYAPPGAVDPRAAYYQQKYGHKHAKYGYKYGPHGKYGGKMGKMRSFFDIFD